MCRECQGSGSRAGGVASSVVGIASSAAVFGMRIGDTFGVVSSLVGKVALLQSAKEGFLVMAPCDFRVESSGVVEERAGAFTDTAVLFCAVEAVAQVFGGKLASCG